ncbi:cellulose binding domain-containing protein [Cellulomonas fimi]|uniref:Cellulose-binding family II n=1 Tax=Cellulomonas fimi (strain ATCC 484 / DSM 20113 / JCM 1341 / CCUG 24087 / LMG 16345 / NBRC 15513 / NCIMB 8980 / NCTC 7547 / NRS-133) TaxID=590998 RepID=F4H6Y1_CELFA|nr:cellulose binding domain-containing protein [Cellulomonas fimi]AEE44490.1 cellulose-binding family II [Cellulomonas fimi ATCC 484]NNH06611.1 rhamnogalacturonan lyase [Cellulomonas fimi]VEH26465.1 Rhamnogalacturonan endolyase yesW precursor [Cellulomonas fimi]
MRARRAAAGLLAAATTATGGVAAAASAQAAVGCRVTYAVTNQWGTGFGGDVRVENLGDALAGWTLTWTFGAGQTVTQAWNGVATQSGAAVSVRDAGYNAQVASGGTVSFGFNGTWNGSSNPAPTSFALNGTTCTGATTPSPTTTPTSTPTTTPTPTPTSTTPPAGAWQAEDLDRGLVSVRSGTANLVQWRLLGTEAASTGFHVYRGGTRITTTPVTGSTNYLDAGAAANASYTVRAVVGGVEQAASAPSLAFVNGYLDVPISKPGSQYAANDGSVGDLDGDGDLEIVLKWDPANAKDNSQSGVTDNVVVDAYRLDGTRLWRIDLGRNIRAGAHYTQFQVYDYDGDGKAEVVMKTADGTRSGTGQVIGDASADHRNSSGYVLSGPEYLTVFHGQTGAIAATTEYLPPRGTVSSWGDSYGNRVDRFLAGTAYLDGVRPSIVMARGYYTRAVVVAWDYRDGKLTRRWTFDSNASGNGTYAGQGNHSVSVADVDGDGRQEILYGAAAIDDDGTGLWNNRTGHGDAGHVGDLVPGRPGLEYYKVTESTSQPDSWMADARTGQILWSTPSGSDNGRGVSGDVWAGSPGAESWSSSDSQLRSTSGTGVARKPSSTNFLSWWDGDTVRELLDGTRIDKYGTGGDTRLLTGSDVHSNNGTKATPVLSGDILGDWREEVVWATSDDTALRVYATPIVTDTRVWTLLHDQQYRVAIAWQNTAYNQPPHPSFFLGSPFTSPAQPSVYLR